jgi:hypothetical protein
MTVRTAVLARHIDTVTGAWQTVATVPAGEVWIVKSVYLYNAGAGSGNIWCQLYNPSTGVIAYFVEGTFSVGSVPPVNGFAVAEVGDQLRVFGTVQPVYSWWSGTKLHG